MLAIIGGTGLYNIEDLVVLDKVQMETPFGSTSDRITIIESQGNHSLFLPRHGKDHQLLPHEINYRANIFARKELGAKQRLGVSAAGSLQENIKPGDFVIPSQYFDFTRGQREKTFFGEGLAAHVSTAEPVSKTLSHWVSSEAKEMGMTIHDDKTYACVDGPRLGTKAESLFLRSAGCDIVGMTNVPEAFLAREAQICYASLCLITDYDCWKDSPDEHASVSAVLSRYKEGILTAKNLLNRLLSQTTPAEDLDCRESLIHSILTTHESMTNEKKLILEVLTT